MGLSALPKGSGRDHVKVLMSFGWVERKAKRGHIILTYPGKAMLLSIPDHREVSLPLLRRELQKAGIDDEDYAARFERLV